MPVTTDSGKTGIGGSSGSSVIGTDTQVPFNDGGVMAGEAAFNYDKTNNRLQFDKWRFGLFDGAVFVDASTGYTVNVHNFSAIDGGSAAQFNFSFPGYLGAIYGFSTSNIGKYVWSSTFSDDAAPDTGLSRNAAGVVEVNNGTPGTYRDLLVRRLTTSAIAVSALPATTGLAGARSFVTDASATTFASVVAGGGANGVPVYCDGTNWRIG